MINIMIPASGSSVQFASEYWPKNCVEICEKPMIQYVIENFESVKNKKFIAILSEEECTKFHTDNMVKLFTDDNAEIIRLTGSTGGALCTGLMAVEYIDNDDELLISNNDQKFDCDMEEVLKKFRKDKVDCGVVTFECVHPRWSYIRLEGKNVVEAAEKRPISKQAIAGLYYFKHGKDFVEAAKNTILKGKDHEGVFYISASINEMILKNKKVGHVEISPKLYHTFYEPKQIEKYELEMRNA